ncbi:hypothetical protein AMATHDRAFT_67122 [Amanita thiersii Skay4041]|uniref:Uncharacterized protein n=1 Tax=Amanita thiersii Skay4041 TaxID=703135 RepID=A0A2A9NJ39_9AGAR|nr:hypothetical protein AMATHDRAFT_67122 [Amanita thiersii Skay4041]
MSSQPSSRLHTFVSFVVVIHTIYILRTLFTPIPNVFTALNIPINTPTDAIQSTLLSRSPDGELPEHIKYLLARLDPFEMRSLYVRYGHNILLTCTHCQSLQDFSLYALPRPLLSYIREITLVGLLTLDALNRAHLRTFGVGVLVAAFVTESYWLATVPIHIPPASTQLTLEDTYMWHDRLLAHRTTLFLLLPLLITLLSPLLASLAASPTLYPLLTRVPLLSLLLPPPPLPPLTTTTSNPTLQSLPLPQLKLHLLQNALKTLDHTVPSLHLLKYLNASVMRNPTLREKASEWWEVEKKEGDAVVSDEGVRSAAQAQGIGFGEGVKAEVVDGRLIARIPVGGEGEGAAEKEVEGPLRTSVRMATEGLLSQGMMPSEHWAPGMIRGGAQWTAEGFSKAG